MKNPAVLVDNLVGWVVAGGLSTGALGLLAALFLLITGNPSAGGICLIAAALSFGLLSIAILAK
jgi:hypothetical protein